MYILLKTPVFCFIKKYLALMLAFCLSIGLVACGGGSDNVSSTSGPTLNLNAAERAYVTGGFSTNGVISGYCQGSKVQNFSATTSGVTYAGLPALISDETETDYLAPNSPAFCTTFYNSNGGPGQVEKIFWDPATVNPMTDGANPPNYVYSNLQAYPSAVTVGSQGTAATYINYYNTSQPITTGALTWSIAADTPTTLLWITVDAATLIATGKPAYTSTTTYRMNADNTVIALNKVIKAFSGFTGIGEDITIYETYP
jgi:hypothetical protein